MKVQRIAAFSDGAKGGNPAGVVLCAALPEVDIMQSTAADVGYSETVFAAPEGEGWRARYFAPTMEVPFCGHATIALGGALALERGDGVFPLRLNSARISVEGRVEDGKLHAALQSPPTRTEPASAALIADAFALFSYQPDDLDSRLPPIVADAGARHLILGLVSRKTLGEMRYGLEEGRQLMASAGLCTISLVHAQTARRFNARNPFAVGGVYEDPATGAAAAALAGYLRELAWPHGGEIEILQGEDMGEPCRIHASIPPEPGSSIRVSGQARLIEAS